MVSTDPWPFDQPRNCASFVTREVMDRDEPNSVLVTHDSDDHGWQFIGSSDGMPCEITRGTVQLHQAGALDRSQCSSVRIRSRHDLRAGLDCSSDRIAVWSCARVSGDLSS